MKAFRSPSPAGIHTKQRVPRHSPHEEIEMDRSRLSRRALWSAVRDLATLVMIALVLVSIGIMVLAAWAMASNATSLPYRAGQFLEPMIWTALFAAALEQVAKAAGGTSLICPEGD